MVGVRTKPCSFCGKTKKLSDFYAHKGKKTNGQSSWCKSCQESDRKKKTADERKKGRQDMFKELVADIRGDRIEVPHPTEVAAEMYEQFGGLKAFCAEWMRHINDAATDRPGSKLVLDAFYAVGIRLTSLSADHRQSAPDLASLTDDELEEEIGKMVAGLLDNRPELINELANKHGLKIHDPAESEMETA
jgi:hypothetical protein